MFLLIIIILVPISILFINQNTLIKINDILLNKNIHTSIIPKIDKDVLLDPYEGPLRDDKLFPNLNIYSSRQPINIATQSFDTSYRQIGILTRLDNTKPNILPLMGRPLITNRDKWNFYTMSDKTNMIKLPIQYKGRKCMTGVGCDNLYTGDVVYVDGYDAEFKVTTYENDTLKYIPYII
jgi:hypothetical protein